MAKIKKIKRERQIFRREYLPILFAFIVLIGLVIVLVKVIKKEAVIPEEKPLENTLSIEEIDVGGYGDYCEGYDLEQLKEDAKKVYLTYQYEPYVREDHPEDILYQVEPIIIDGIRINVFEIGSNIKVKIIEELIDDWEINTVEHVFIKSDTNTSYSYIEEKITNLIPTTVRVYANDPKCGDLLLREFETTLPRRNLIPDYGVCESFLFAGTKECEDLVFTQPDTVRDLNRIMDMGAQIEQAEEEAKNRPADKKKNWVIIVVGIVALVIIIVILIIMKGRRNNNEKDN